jgi:Spherulation-specific family 4
VCDRHAAMRRACRSVWQFNSNYCRLLQEAGKSNVIAVINPNSGPDFTGGDATVKCLPHLKRAGNTLIGYVATGDACYRWTSSAACVTRLSFTLRAGPADTKEDTALECVSCTLSAGYGKRSLSDISKDLQRYRAAYAPYLTGVFFDEGISW